MNGNLQLWAEEWNHHFPVVMFSLEPRLVCAKSYRLFAYIPVECFTDFVQSAVEARKQEDENCWQNN